MGYKNGDWEFTYDGSKIQEEMMKMTYEKGVLYLNIDKNWIVSDDTILQLATGEALITGLEDDKLLKKIASLYVKSINDMENRAPGKTTIECLKTINEDGGGWDKIPFNLKGGGCGAAMRSSCIGLLYHQEKDFDKLMKISIESGRMTHHHPTGYLGSLASALFTSFAIRNINPKYWPDMLLSYKNKIKDYIIEAKRDVHQNLEHFDYFINHFINYIDYRNLPTTEKGYGIYRNERVWFPKNYSDVKIYDRFYKEISFGGLKNGWGGSSGHDSVLIALDALLYAESNWENLCLHAMLHGGDNDTTGSIAGAWFGALYGFYNVPKNHYENLEYLDRLIHVGETLYQFN